MRFVKAFAALSLCAAVSSAAAAADEIRSVDIVVSPMLDGTARGFDTLKAAMAQKKIALKIEQSDVDENALARLDPPPDAALVNAFEIQDLFQQGRLGDISATAVADGWDRHIYQFMQRYLVRRGRWIAAPLDVELVNEFWINLPLMDKIGGLQPKTFDALIALLDKAKDSGVAPLTVGADPTDQAALFDMVVIATAGSDYYKRAFSDLSEAALDADKLKTAFDNLARLRAYVGQADLGRDAKTALDMVVKGEALAHVAPGSAKLAFIAANKIPNKDFLCDRFPGTSDAFLYRLDILAMLEVDPARRAAQQALASEIVDPETQKRFSVASATLPARGDAYLDSPDACAADGVSALIQSNAAGAVFGSMARGWLQPPAMTAAYVDIVSRFYRGDINSSEAAARALIGVLNKSKTQTQN